MPDDNDDDNDLYRGRRERMARVEHHDFREHRIDVADLFNRLGYDVTKSDDIVRLGDDLRWAAQQRKRIDNLRSHRLGFIVTGLIAFMSVSLTVLGQWMIGRLGGK